MKFMKLILALAGAAALGIGVFALSGCNKGEAEPEYPNTVEWKDYMVYWSPDTIKVVLQENSSTGYVWSVVGPSDCIAATDESHYKSDGVSAGAPGERWFYLTIAQGAPASFETSVGLANSRSWEEGSVIDALTVMVTVTDGKITFVDLAD